METTATLSRISRVDSRYRHRAQSVPPHEERELEANADEVEASLDGFPNGRDTMSRGHRLFHRRAARGATQVVTVAVEIVATVDTNGNTVATETRAAVTPQDPSPPTMVGVAAVSVAPAPSVPSQSSPALPAALPAASAPPAPALPSASAPPAPAVPAVPPMPTPALPSLPVVPSVPPFPSDLVVPTVPAFPFPSGVPPAASSGSVIPSPVPTGGPESTVAPSPVPAPSLISTLTPLLNSTIPTTYSFFSTPSTILLDSSISASFSASPSASSSRAASPSLATSSSRSSPSVATVDAISARSTATASNAEPTTTAYYGDVGGGAPVNSGAAPAATTAAITNADADTSPAPLETPQVVGSVVGSLAGAALILAIVLLLLRRHKRKCGGALQLTGDDHTDNVQSVRQVPTTTFVPAAFLHRFSGMSGKTALTNSSAGEPSFQRISGRKLPSAFSEGMTSDQVSRGATISGSTFYQDDQGIYGSPGTIKEFGKEIGDTTMARESGQMNIRPSPARTPVIRHPDDDVDPFTDHNHLSPPQSPKPEFPARGTLGRSLHSADGSRSSRFTENV
ncbi:hypothetical protein EJ02DRAFT_83298 [Clathrospora elynae]|uniref:Uncharacterized protein n=1 Tax=Clathrospora elynae TaxID=706981 RepID=A0A6A5SAJ6_9PLEO|nr:hypothetical protein EJ02DRAFT_83298 [Clathrospora elynae]